jgi:hypothetical protein
VAEGVVDDISHEGLRVLLREEGVSFQRLKTWKAAKDPHYAAKKARIEHLYAIADGEVIPAPGEPQVIFCVDEFGPLNLPPRPGRQWAAVSGKSKEPGRYPRRRIRATYNRTGGIRHLFAAYELGEDRLYGHIKPRKTRARFLEFCRYLRSLCPPLRVKPPVRAPHRHATFRTCMGSTHRRPSRRGGRQVARHRRITQPPGPGAEDQPARSPAR